MLQPGKAGPRSWERVEEKKSHTDLPEFFTFPSKEAKEYLIYENFFQVNREVDQMCIDFTQFAKK